MTATTTKTFLVTKVRGLDANCFLAAGYEIGADCKDDPIVPLGICRPENLKRVEQEDGVLYTTINSNDDVLVFNDAHIIKRLGL